VDAVLASDADVDEVRFVLYDAAAHEAFVAALDAATTEGRRGAR
jgi:hypothetical protein